MKKTYLYVVSCATILIFLISTLYVDTYDSAKVVNKLTGLCFLPLWFLFSRKVVLTPIVVIYAAFIAWCLISFPATGGNWDYAWKHLKTMVLLAGILFFISGLLDDHKSLKPLAIILLAYFLISYFGDRIGFRAEQDNERLQGITANANTLGFICLNGLLACLYLIERWEFPICKLTRENSWALFLLFAILILPTGSRKSFATLVIFFVVYSLVSVRRNSLRIVIILIIGGGGALLFSNQIFEQFETSVMGQRVLDEATLNRGANIRIMLAQDGVEMFLEKPIFGVGINNYAVYQSEGRVSHSYYIETLANTGVLGFAILFSAYLWVFRGTWRLYRRRVFITEATFILGFLLITFVMSFGSSYHRSFGHWIFLVMIASFLENPAVKPFAQRQSPYFLGEHSQLGI